MKRFSEINAGVVGVGFIGVAHVEALRRIGVTVAGVAGSSPERAQAKADVAHLPKVYDSAESLVADPNIDVIHVATPNNLHYDQVRACLDAGKHVVCEKPLAGTLADAEAMAEAAAAAAGQTFVWYNYRRVPAVALAHQIVQSGALGRIYHVRAAYLQSWGGPDTPLVWRFQADVAGQGSGGIQDRVRHFQRVAHYHDHGHSLSDGPPHSA